MAFVSAHNWPFIHEFSADDRRLAEDARSELEERKRRSFEARRQKAAEIGEDVRRQLRDLLGAETARELRQLMARERIALRHRRQPPDGLSLDFVEANAARKAKVDRLLQQRGISGERIASIGAAARRKLVQTLSQIEGKVVTGHALSLNLENWKKLSPLNKLSLPWGEWPFDEDPNDPHRWFLFRPPFFGFDWTSFLGREGDFRINRDHIIDPAAGLVGNDVTMDCDDASTFSYDWAWAEVETYTAFGFEAPRAGLIEVLIDAQSALAKHYVKTEGRVGPI
jgi:hypothetical protein